MTKEFVWVINEDGKPCKCFAKPENRGKGKCPHKFHQVKGETTQQLLSRSKRKVAYQGVSGTVKWSVDDDGLLLFEPIDGEEGMLNDVLHNDERWSSYSEFIKKIEATGKIYLPKNSSYIFRNLIKLTNFDLSHFDTSKVKNTDNMFSDCRNLTNLDLSNFDTSNVTSMRNMFNGCAALEQVNLSSFDTSNVTNMGGMFSGCASLCNLNLSNFDTSNVKNMGVMFRGCSSLDKLDLSNFDTSKAKDMQLMFADCSLLTNLDLSNFRTDNVRAFNSMFSKCFNLRELDISNFCFNKSPYVFGMFSSAGISTLNMENIKSDVDFCLTRPPEFSCHYIVPKEIEKIAKRITNPSILALLDLNRIDDGFHKPFVKKVLTALDTTTQLDFKNDLAVIQKTHKRDCTLALYKAMELTQIDGHLGNDLIGASAILTNYDITIEKLKCLDQNQVINLFDKTGIASDINAYLNGVPIEDILA